MKELLYLGVKLAASCVEAGYEKVKEDWSEKFNIDDDSDLSFLYHLPLEDLKMLHNILISEDKDISMLIMDRYNLFGFNLTKDKLDKDNIDNLIKELEIILNSIVMNKNRITDSRIKFIKDTNNI